MFLIYSFVSFENKVTVEEMLMRLEGIITELWGTVLRLQGTI